jgi:tetratricopeptide (TPR) repeat protein
MSRFALCIVNVVWALLAATATGQTTATHPSSGAEAPTAVSETASTVIELMHEGRTIRIPIVDGRPAELEIDGARWQLQLAAPPVAGTAGSDFPPPDSEADRAPVRPPTDQAAADGQSASTMQWWRNLSIETKVMLGALLSVLAYFFLIEPLRRRRPLKEALKILRQDERPQFARAEELLDQSLLAGLRKKDIALARFALGYLRARLGKYEEASTVLADLEHSGVRIDGATAYLTLWVQSKLANHERVERIYNEHQKRLKDRQQVRLIVSISYLALARMRWARREINAAMHYFDEVRRLEELADEIPSHIDDHEVVIGTMSLFERNPEEAEKHFRAAIKAAADRSKPAHPGQLGLLLCQWRAEERPDIDGELGEILQQMQAAAVTDDATPVDTECTHCGKTYRVRGSYCGRKVQCKGCRRRFVVEATAPLEEGESAATEAGRVQEHLLNDEELLFRNARLWHCLSLLFTWLRRPPGSRLQEQDLPQLTRRVNRVIQIDPDFGDANLVLGLIRYYFATNQQERKAGRALIAKAVEKDVHVPEVLQLMDRENKLAALAENSLGYFHQLARQYAENGEVDPGLRARFLQHMNRFRRFRDLGEIDSETLESSSTPSLENLQGRGQILQTRLSNIVRHRLTDEDADIREGIQGGLAELQQHADVLNRGVQSFQQTELTLMESTGEFLFEDEQPLETTESASDFESSNGDSDGHQTGS